MLMLMREGTAPLIRREDYAEPPFWIRKADLTFDLDGAKTIVGSKLAVERNAKVARAPLVLHGDGITLLRVMADGQSVTFRHGGERRADHRQPARGRHVHARAAHHLRARQEQAALGPVRLGLGPVHAVRSRRVSPHHLLPRPAGRDGGVHGDAARRQEQVPGAAVQRQPGRRRHAGQRPPLRQMARPVSEAELPVRARRRQALGAPPADQDTLGQGPSARDLHPPRRHRQDRACDGVAGRLDRLGRAPLRPAARSGALHDRCRRRLQHGRDGEQGPEHLQHAVRAGQPRHRHRHATTTASKPWSATSTSTTGPATASPAATGSSSR